MEGQAACSFCGRTEEAVDKLISGPNVYICDKCINLCVEIIDKPISKAQEQKPKDIKLLKPCLLYTSPSPRD